MSEEKYIAEQDLETVDSIYSELLKTQDISKFSDFEKTVFLIENYNIEINSGLDFIQWYRWSDTYHLKETPTALRNIGLTDSYDICTEALNITFPNGLPNNEDDKDGIIESLEDDDKNESLRNKLVALAKKQEEQNYTLTTELASWIRSNKE